MGLDCTVRFPAGRVPAWDAIKGQLARLGEAPPLRMIDGLPAFPDESPPDDWREIRAGFAGGMVALRRGADSITCVVWSNADPALLATRDRVAWACASAGQGTVVTAAGEVSADEFARQCGIKSA
jgi:hypothetical protein